MDQSQWNALNQMLSQQQRRPGQTATAAKTPAGRQGGVQTRVISAGSSTGAQRGGRQVNGQQTMAETGGSGVVKSLLTGRQYGQSVLRPDIGRAAQTKTVPAKTTAPKQQVSVLQPNWQQQQTVDASGIAAETQQLVLSGLPDNIGPGESLYVVVDGVTYQIDSSNAELLAAAAGGTSGGASVLPLGSRISLEDLANISAEQQTLSLDYQAAANEMGVSVGDVKMEMQSASDASTINLQQIDGQQYLEGQTAVTTSTGNGTEPMQIIILPADGSDMKSGDFKVGSQDFILQPGQQLPPELQEMVARGLPIDFSNYEFVIQEDDGSGAHDGGAGTTYLSASQQLGGAGDASSMMVSGNEDILNMLGDGSGHQGGMKMEMHHWATAGTSSVPVIEEDDGEFAYVMSSIDESGEAAASGVPRQIVESGFLTAFHDFINGAKAETLSSVANSTVIRKQPQLPIAYVPETSRKTSAQSGERKTAMTVVFNEGGSQQVVYVNESGTPRGRGRGRGRPPNQTNQFVVQKFAGRGGATLQKPDGAATHQAVGNLAAAGAREQIRQSIIAKRKRKGSDSDSYDEEDEEGFHIDENMEKELITASKSSSLAQDASIRGGVSPASYRGRGRPRGSALLNKPMGRGTGTSGATTSLASGTEQQVIVLEPEQHKEQPQPQPVSAEAVFHLNPTEPHTYQKGDFVIERKDIWKTEGFPIWRIETGKLLQKFDPIPVEGGIVHKSASVYSSWSGDIRTSFKAILVDMITSTAGRKQETVKVQERFVSKAADDSLDEDPLMGTFAVFMHTMMSAALDSTFLASIVQNEEDEYYMSSVRQIDTLLTAATQSILSQIAWTETFKLSADALPYYVMTSLPQTSEQPYQCQACEDGVTPAVRSVKFYGVVYDRDLLTPTAEVDKASAQEFLIGKPASEILISYHALQHFKFLLHQKCQEEVVYMRQTKKSSDVEILTECLQNRIFLQHYFRDLQSLLQQFIIVEHAVEPSVDEATLEAQAALEAQAQAAYEAQQGSIDQSALEGMNIMSSVADPATLEAQMAAVAEDQTTAEGMDLATMEMTGAEAVDAGTEQQSTEALAADQATFEPIAEPMVTEDGSTAADVAPDVA